MIAAILYTALTVIACAVGIRYRDRGGSAQWIAAWCTLVMVGNLASLLTAFLRDNNHWIGHYYLPIATVMIAGAARIHFNGYPRLRTAVWLGAAMSIASWVALTASVESIEEFSRYSAPIHFLFAGLVGVALVASSILEQDVSPMLNASSWIGIALVLIHFPALAADPIAKDLARLSPADVLDVWFGAQWAKSLGTLVIIVTFVRSQMRWTA